MPQIALTPGELATIRKREVFEQVLAEYGQDRDYVPAMIAFERELGITFVGYEDFKMFCEDAVIQFEVFDNRLAERSCFSS